MLTAYTNQSMRAVVYDRYGAPDVMRFEEVALRAVVDRCYPLEDVVAATRYVETGQKVGNVVLTLG